MKELSLEHKNAIRDALSAYCDNYLSRNRAAESLNGVSAATVSTIVNSKYTNISDDMFIRIATQIGFSFDCWEIHESVAFKEISFMMTDAQMYRKKHRNVFYILCSEDMKKSDFVREISKQVGAPTDGTNLRDMLEYAISMIAFLGNPLIIFDEGDKLTDSVFNYFISIYNRLEGHAGIIFLSTNYIKRRLENGLRYNKKGYKEIYSRIGRRFFEVKSTTQNDIHAICQANGLTDEAEIKKVLKDAEASENDLRRVKRCVHSRKRIMDARARKGEAE